VEAAEKGITDFEDMLASEPLRVLERVEILDEISATFPSLETTLVNVGYEIGRRLKKL